MPISMRNYNVVIEEVLDLHLERCLRGASVVQRVPLQQLF